MNRHGETGIAGRDCDGFEAAVNWGHKLRNAGRRLSFSGGRGIFASPRGLSVGLCVMLIACAAAARLASADSSDPPATPSANSPSSAPPRPASSGAARLSNLDGSVQVLRGSNTEFQRALLNMPVTEGSRLVTSNDGRVEVQFEDGSIARITPNSSLSVNVLQRNSDGSMVTEVELLGGLGYFELKPPAGQQLDAVRFGTNLLTVSSSAVLRINRDADPAELSVLSGDVHVAGGTQFNVDVHSNETIRFDAVDSSRYYLAAGVDTDSWDQWNSDRDEALAQAAAQESTVAAGHGDPDNPAWSDLDASGSWYSVPGYGDVWTPAGVGAGWDPYGAGSWAYYPGYGYTWVSGYPWGWLPYRCGGWNYFNSFGWGWLPGSCGYGYGFGGDYGLGSGAVVYTSPRGYIPPSRPILKGPVARLASNQRVISVDRGVNARSIAPVKIANSNAPPQPIVFAGQRLEPISAKFNPERGTTDGTALRQNASPYGSGSGGIMPGSVSAPLSSNNRPWFVQGSGMAEPRSGVHPVQQYPVVSPGYSTGVSPVRQPPPWSMPPSRGSAGQGGGPAPVIHIAPQPAAPHYSAPPAAPPASHPSSAPAAPSGGHTH